MCTLYSLLKVALKESKHTGDLLEALARNKSDVYDMVGTEGSQVYRMSLIHRHDNIHYTNRLVAH